MLAACGIAAAFTSVPLSERTCLVLTKKFGKNVKLLLLVFMFAAAIISAFISNIPTTIIFVAMSEQFLSAYENPRDKEWTGKAFMIGIPISTFLGGLMTPIGSSINLLCFNQLQAATGLNFTFIQWMAIGAPFGIIMLPIAWWILCKVYKPVEIGRDKIDNFISDVEKTIPRKMGKKEKTVLGILAVMLCLWIASSWVKAIDIYVVAFIGCCVFMLPQPDIVTWDTFMKSASWDVILITCSVISLGTALVNNGVSTWLVNTVFPDTIAVPFVGFVALLSLFIFLLMIILPVAPSIVTLLSVPIVTIATAQGFSVQMLFAVLVICVGQCYLLPIDAIPLLAYSKGYFKMSEMPKATAPIQLCAIIVITIWVPIAGKLLGMI